MMYERSDDGGVTWVRLFEIQVRNRLRDWVDDLEVTMQALQSGAVIVTPFAWYKRAAA
jgi:hypothetical protein